MDIQSLIEKRANLWNKAKKFLDDHTDADGTISAKDAATYDKMEEQIDMLGAQIERLQKQAVMDNYLAQPANRPILNNPAASFATPTVGYRKSGVVGNEYHRNFINAFRERFSTKVVNYLNEGALADGGYLLPEEFDNQLVTKLQQDNLLRQISRVITTESTHKINIVASEPAASWVAEGEEIQLNSPQFAQKILSAYKLAIGTKTSNELLQDSFFDLETALIDMFSRSIAAAEEEAFINGTGTNQPLGILPALSATASSFITSRGLNEISADDCIALYYSLERPYRRNAVWLASDSAVENLRRLRDANQAFLWTNSLVEGEPPTFLGRAIYTSPAMPAVASGYVPLLFGDFQNFFVIGDRGSRTVKPLRELFALSDSTAFLMIERVDCCVTDFRAFRGIKMK